MKKTVSPRFTGGFFRIPLVLIIVLTVMFSWQSCSEPDGIGLGLIDDQAGFLRTDTFSIQAFFEPDDTIPTNIGYQNLLGMMNDPVFGKVRASIITQFRLPVNNFTLGEDPVLDSIVLSLGYTGRHYGNLETFQTIRVYELVDAVPDADSLFSNQPLEVFPRPIGERILRPAPNDSTLIDTLYFPPHFTVRLANNFGQKIIDANGTEFFENITNWLEYFKGLKITVADNFSEGGSVFNIDMFSFYTSLRIYYRLEGDTLQSPRQYSFYINDFTRRMTYVEHFDFEGSHPLIAEQLNNPDQPNDSLIFLKALGGLRGRIKLPHIELLNEVPNISINQAKLIIPIDTTFIQEQYYAARTLFLMQIDEEDELAGLRDYDLGLSYFGGFYNDARKQYEFNVTQHLQQVINGRIENNDLILIVSGGAENAERVVLRGPGRAENPMRLEVRYSLFN